MKHLLLRPFSTTIAALLTTAGFAQAHPGHSAFDWTVLPHAGHASEHAAFYAILALTTIGCIAHWAISRKR